MLRGTLISFLLAAALAAAPTSNPVGALAWVKQIGGSGINQVAGTAVDAQGNFYVAASTSSPDFDATKTIGKCSGTSVVVIELDPNGKIVYAVRIGGSGIDTAAGIALAADGSVFVAGTTTSTDFPVTKGAYQTTVTSFEGAITSSSFLLRLNPDASLAWATYFGDWMTSATAIAVGPDGSPYIAGLSYGNLPTTPGAYLTQFQTVVNCTGVIGCYTPPPSGFLTKFEAGGSALIYSTYTLTGMGFDLEYSVTQWGGALAIDSLGNAYFTSGDQETSITIGVMNAGGSALLYSLPAPGGTAAALALDPEGNVYVTGFADSNFQPTAGAFQTPPPVDGATGYFGNYAWSGAYIAKLDGGLSHTIAAALLGARGLVTPQGIAIDSTGNVVIGGYTTARNLPAQLPFQGSFVDEANFWGQDDLTPTTGFVARLDSTLSHLLFSTYAGDTRAFGVNGVACAPNGDILLAGQTSVFYQQLSLPAFMPGGAIVANRIAFAPPPPVTLDSVVNFASKYAVPLSPGEAVQALGSGFGADAQILVDGSPVPAASRSATSVVGLLPMDLKTSGTLKIEVESGGAFSNTVLMPAAVSSPGIYSIHGTGLGQGYIRNADGSFNSPNRPAKPGDAITIFATGVGDLGIESGFVVTPQPIAIFVDEFYANGVSSAYSGAGALPGKTYQITVTIPTAAEIVKNIPGLVGFKYPPVVAVTMVLGPVHTQNEIYPENSAAVSQPGIALYIRN